MSRVKMLLLCIIFMSTFISLSGVDEQPSCSSGQFLDKSGMQAKCEPCEPGTFMPEENHVNENCIACKKADKYLHQIESEPCTLTKDTVIGCEPGSYKTGLRGHEECQKCTKCEDLYVGQDCRPDRDTVCCPQSGMTVKTDANGSQTCVKTSNGNAVIHKCRAGHFLNYTESGQPSCPRCPNGTFNAEPLHSVRRCEPCTTASQRLNQIAVKPCTPTSDTIIGCASDHFKDGIKCQRCTTCEGENRFEVRPCGADHNRLCCPSVDMNVEKDPSGNLMCGYAPPPLGQVVLLCPKGHYLHSQTECLPCGKGTFIPVANHSYKDCEPCRRAERFAHEIELAPCIPTRDTVIGCENSYFRFESGATDHDGECQKCTDCKNAEKNKYIGQECGQFHDTVCCPGPDMTVQKDNDGVSFCVYTDKGISSCGKGTYLSEVSPNVKRCLPCPGETFMASDNHTNIECRLCTKVESFNLEREARPCNATTDTLVMCMKGHFRVEEGFEFSSVLGSCYACTKCSSKNMFEGRPCDDYNDAVCCTEKGAAVIKNETTGEFECVDVEAAKAPQVRIGRCLEHEYVRYRIHNSKKVICHVCSRNDYHVSSDVDNGVSCAGNQSVEVGLLRNGSCEAGEYIVSLPVLSGFDKKALCVPCKNGTYMDMDDHHASQCKSCTPTGGRPIVQKCRRNHDTIFDEEKADPKSGANLLLSHQMYSYTIVILIALTLL